jgi:hypothetical protein
MTEAMFVPFGIPGDVLLAGLCAMFIMELAVSVGGTPLTLVALKSFEQFVAPDV